MDTPTLKEKINNSLAVLLPLFGVSEEELRTFKEPTIRRELEKHEFLGFPRECPAYYALKNYFYWPTQNAFTWPDIFETMTVNHEVSHYIHHSINPGMNQGLVQCEETGKRPSGHENLCEIVAEYANFILGVSDNLESWQQSKDVKNTYEKYGSSFLPALVRMSLDEALSGDIVKIR